MSVFSRYRAELAWVGLLLSIPVLGLVHGSSSRKEAGADTWGAGRAGKKVFFTLLQRLLTDVERSPDRLDPPGAGTLLVLGPARYPDAAEWRKLHEWVVAGHTLVLAAGRDDPAVTLTPFGLRVRAGSDAAGTEGGDHAVIDETLVAGPAAPLPWTTSAVVEGARADAWVPLRVRGRPVAVVQKEGGGTLAVLASDELFDNASLVDPDTALVAFRLIERVRANGKVVFDESLNLSGGPKIVGLLFGGGLRALTLQLVALVVLFGWTGARVFGPRITAEPASRRQMTEHAVAFGHLCYKADAGARLVATYLEYFRRELGLLHAARTEAGAADLLSRRARTDVSAVRRALALGRAVQDARRASRAQAAEAITALASLKQRADHPV